VQTLIHIARRLQVVALILLAALAPRYGLAATAISATLEPHASAGRGAPRAPGYLGIGFHDVGDDQMAALHVKAGRPVEVVMVDHDGPAGQSGLRPHDILISLNGTPIGGSEALHRMLRDAGAGTGITLAVLREGRPLTVNVQLADRNDVERQALARMADPLPPPEEDAVVSGFMGGYVVEPTVPNDAPRGQSFLGSVLHSTPFTGLALDAMHPQLAEFFGAPPDSGLLVEMVVPNSPAALAGLRAGDVLLRADGVVLRSAADWTRRLHAAKGPMALAVLRDKHEIGVTLMPDARHRSAVDKMPLCAVKYIYTA